MLVVAITGGIGSGKSTVADFFRELGVPVFDADVEARALAVPGQPAFAAIVGAFGDAILDPQGDIDRTRLRDIVFADAVARRKLEEILHPRVKDSLRAKVRVAESAGAPYCIVVVPLLFEANHTDLADRILVVDAPEQAQIARTSARPGMTADAARKIIAAQWSREQRLARADDVIRNDSGLDTLRAQVAALDSAYRQAATQGLPRRPNS
jgi:dephospho-CoA kinase